MAFDFKKEYKEFYLPPVTPTLVDVPSANYIAVRYRLHPDARFNRSDNLIFTCVLTALFNSDIIFSFYVQVFRGTPMLFQTNIQINHFGSICFLRVRIACNRYRAANPTPTK